MAKKILGFFWIGLATIGAGASIIHMCLTKAWVLLPFAIALIALAVPSGIELYRSITSE